MRYQDYIRNRILDAAEAEFLEHGYAGASINRIVQTIGGSKATIFRNFQSKEAMFAVVVERIATSMMSEFDLHAVDAEEVGDGLSRFGRGLLLSGLSERALRLTRIVIAEGVRFPSVGHSFVQIGVQPMTDRLEQQLARWAERGQIVCGDARRDAQLFIGMAASGWLNWTLLGIGAEPDEATVDRHVASAVDLFLEGRRPR